MLLEKNRKRLAPGTAALARKVALRGPYCKWTGSPSCELRHGERLNHDWCRQNPEIQRASPAVLNKKQRGVCLFAVVCSLREVRKRLQHVLASRPAELQHVQEPEAPGAFRLGPTLQLRRMAPRQHPMVATRDAGCAWSQAALPFRCEHRAPVDSQDLPGARRRRSRARLLPTPRAAARHRGRPSAGQRSRGRPARRPPGSRGCRASRPVPNQRCLPSVPPFTAASSICSACAATRPRKLTTAKAPHAARS